MISLWQDRNELVTNTFEYMKIIYVYCGFMKCMKAILAVVNPTYVVAEIGPENIHVCSGFEPMTSAIPMQCSANIMTSSQLACQLVW